MGERKPGGYRESSVNLKEKKERWGNSLFKITITWRTLKRVCVEMFHLKSNCVAEKKTTEGAKGGRGN